jgi:translation initiation factor IF-2
MPQTIEAINHAKAAEVPIIVAVNKTDKPTANADRVMTELGEYGLYPEAWGGDTIFVPLSALTGEGIDELLEMITLVGEMAELKTTSKMAAIGTVIDAELDKSRGPAASLLVQHGTLNVGDSIVVGSTFGKVRAMVSDTGQRIKSAGPSVPVEITGINDVPEAGDRFVVFEDDKKARSIGEARHEDKIMRDREVNQKVSLDNLFEQMKEGEMKDLNIIIKGDAQGSVEALAASLMKIDVEGVNVRIIHTGVGAINESDVTLANASSAIIIGFNVRPDVNAKRAAEQNQIDMRLHRIIYKVIEEIESAMKGMLDPEYEEKVIGNVEVREIFKVSKVGTIAGAYVTDGKITRDSGVRVIRDGIVVFEGELDTLKRFKDDAKEVTTGYECGLTIKNFNDIKEGDQIEPFIMVEIERK